MTDLRLILPVTGRLRWIVICTAVTVRAISARPEASPQATARWCGSCMLPGGPDPPAPIGGPGSSSARAHTLPPAGGPRGSAHCPGPAQRSAGPAARCAAAAGLQQAKRAAGGRGPTPGRCCGLGPRASPSHRTGDSAATGRTSPPERLLPVCSLPIHRLRAAYGSCMLRYQARQLCWRKCRVAAASSGLVCARPKLLGASFACDFDRECQMRRRFVDATQRAGSFARCASSTLISVRSCGLWRLTGG